ncbi:MAG TPA: urease accessory protein UreD [Xanthobacteraceae bacterium]|nr:urease accessory protein UreD [Xanthobacteraceae bacterium]
MFVNVSLSEAARRAKLPSLRTEGSLRLVARAASGRTRAIEVGEAGPLRVRFPRLGAGKRLEAITLNTAGGIAGGDRLAISVEAAAGAEIVVTSQAAEKVYRAAGPPSRVALTLKAGPGASIDWLPQETILFDQARLARRLEIDLAADARVTVCEAIVFGRAAMGERMQAGSVRDQWRIRRGGKLVFADALRIEGEVDKILSRPAVANGAAAIATIVRVASDAEAGLDALRAAFDPEIEAGASAFGGILVARLIARDGFTLRRAIIAALCAIGSPPPRAYLL